MLVLCMVLKNYFFFDFEECLSFFFLIMKTGNNVINEITSEAIKITIIQYVVAIFSQRSLLFISKIFVTFFVVIE